MTQAPVIVMSRSQVAERMLRYPEARKEGAEEPRVLYREGINCFPETAIQEFATLRRRHGKQGAMRKAPAIYKLPEAGEAATHARRGRRWIALKDRVGATHRRVEGAVYDRLLPGESDGTHKKAGKAWVAVEPTEATHRRVEGGYLKESEALHMIFSAGLDSVNPKDPEDVQRMTDYVNATVRAIFPAVDGSCGVQAKLVTQADAQGMVDENGNRLTAGGKAHVHVVINTVVLKEMEMDGRVWRPGQKLSGALTDIDRVRQRHDAFANEHGAQWGFEQGLASVAESKAEKRSAMDRRMAAQGKMSDRDVIRTAITESLEDPRSIDREAFTAVLEERGVEATHRQTKSGKNKGEEHLSFKLPSMKTNVRGRSLGGYYTYEDTVDKESGEVVTGLRSQLEAIAEGAQYQPRPARRQAGPPKTLPVPTPEEIAVLEEAVEVLADIERETVAAAVAAQQAAEDARVAEARANMSVDARQQLDNFNMLFSQAQELDSNRALTAYGEEDVEELERIISIHRQRKPKVGATTQRKSASSKPAPRKSAGLDQRILDRLATNKAKAEEAWHQLEQESEELFSRLGKRLAEPAPTPESQGLSEGLAGPQTVSELSRHGQDAVEDPQETLTGAAAVVEEVPTASDEAPEGTKETAVTEPTGKPEAGGSRRRAAKPRAVDQAMAPANNARFERFPELKNTSVDRLKPKDWGEQENEPGPGGDQELG